MTAGTASASTLTVTVKDPQGLSVPGATVTLAEARRDVVTSPEGRASFADLPAGTYHVSVRLSGFLSSRLEVSVSEDAPAAVDVVLSDQVHFSETVTVSPRARDTFEAYQPTAVLSGEELQQRLGATLGDTLGSQVGVNARSFGPGASRPVIRGLDGDRVLILENGARTGDLSSQSGDHGVPVDPASAQQIEVVRGPATLLYGSNALGGVVNVVSEAIPTRAAHGWSGGLAGQGGTANDEAGASGSLAWGNGQWAMRTQGTARRTDDVRTPSGRIPNSGSDMLSGGVGVARTGPHAYFGASYFYDDSSYGVPFIEDGDILLNPRRHRIDVRTERRNLSSWVEAIKLQLGYRDYRHDERHGGDDVEHEPGEEEHGTSFRNRMAEAQLMLNHHPLGKVKGTAGAWFTTRTYDAQGEEALAPKTDQTAFAGFVYEELPVGHLTFQAGARLDHTSFSPMGLPSRSFTEMSGSLGVLGYLRENVTVAANVARAARNPSLEELYNEGPHPGNFTFERGNPDLTREVGTGFDLSVRWRSARFIGEITAFRNDIDDFIFPLPTGEIEDELPVVTFVARDSRIQGLEAHVDFSLTDALWVELGADGVRGEIREADEPLPRMPPFRAWLGLRYERNGFHLEGEVRGVSRQRRVYGSETPTAGYAVINTHGAYTFAAGRTVHTVTLRVDNAGDRLYRSHLSFVKDRAPEMGRTVKLVYGFRF